MANQTYHVVGLMSGTSLDGVDLAFCKYIRYRGKWNYQIIHATTLGYSAEWLEKLNSAAGLDAENFLKLHRDYGRYLGLAVNQFLGKGFQADLVASHGHTVFHQPESGLTFQLGDGASVAAGCGVTTVSDFRILDVAHGGEGAPLVPSGDELLFGEYDVCLNLGGFANISFNSGNRRIAFDICPVNIILNRLARQKGLEYDEDGRLGRGGRINDRLVNQLNNIAYYARKEPKSMSREWFERVFLPVVSQSDLAVEDRIRSIYEHIAIQIGNCMQHAASSKVLATGGGAFNSFLVERLTEKGMQLVIPESILVKYKEALVFGLLGVLRYRDEINCLASVTGGSRDLSAGIINAV